MLGRKTTTSAEPEAAPVKSGGKKKYKAAFEPARSRDEVQVQAYYNYLKRVTSNFPGSPEADWLEAEKSVMLKMKAR